MIKKISTVFLAVALALCVLSFTACKKTENERCVYEIEAQYDETTQTLDAQMDFTFVNDTDTEISQLKFNLFGNAFRKDAKFRPVSSGHTASAYYSGLNYGEMNIKSVEGQVLEWQICGQDENILSVTLSKGVFPNEKCELEIEYSLLFAKINHRTGVTKRAVNLGNFYPQLCAYDNGFYECEYYSAGDPFYSECADYNVTLSLDSDFVVASSGVLKDKRAKGDDTQYKYELISARDFCFVFSKDFQVISEKIDGVEINYYYYADSNANDSFETGKKCIEYFSDAFGAYPYKNYSIVQTGFCYGGMEYPALSMISDSLSKINNEYTIAHETAHQWWYSAVGNNQIENAWQDEGLTEYSTVMFFESHPEYKLTREKLVKSAYDSYKSYYGVYTQLFKEVDTTMNRKLCDFQGEYEYTNIAYNKGVILFDNLRQSIGDNRFKNGLKRYYSEYRYKIAKPENLISSFQKSGVDLVGFFSSYINGKAVI